MGILLLTGFLSDAQAFKWETAKHNGQDHVTLRSVKSFYFFDKITYGTSIVLYRSERIQQGRKTVEGRRRWREGRHWREGKEDVGGKEDVDGKVDVGGKEDAGGDMGSYIIKIRVRGDTRWFWG